jgi:hypothetical protein
MYHTHAIVTQEVVAPYIRSEFLPFSDAINGSDFRGNATCLD